MSEKVLKLNGVLLNKLPDNFSFDGTLDLRGSSLTELPMGLYVTGDLYLGDRITAIPPEAIIGGNVYFTQTARINAEGEIVFNTLKWDESSIVCGWICFEEGVQGFLKPSNKTNYIILDNGEKFWYKNKKHYSHKVLRNHDFDRTPFDLYESYDNKKMAVQWSTSKGCFAYRCNSLKEAKFLVNYQDAIERGLEKYKGLDIDTPMLGHDILEIYQVCTHSCMKVVQEYLDRFGFNLDNYYTLREIGYAVQQFKIERYAPASDVFMFFFNIPNIKEEAN
jgi:hypothetical protein